MKKPIRVGYIPFVEPVDKGYHIDSGWVDLVAPDIVSLDLWEGIDPQVKQCPAVSHYLQNTWCLKSPINVLVYWNRETQRYESNIPDPEAESVMIRPRNNGEFDPLVDLGISWLFLADEPVWLRFGPADYHYKDGNWKIIPGTFNIHRWQRPVNICLNLNKEEPALIHRGDTVAYANFHGEDPDRKIKLERMEMTDEIYRQMSKCLAVKSFMPKLSWKMITGIEPVMGKIKKWLK